MGDDRYSVRIDGDVSGQVGVGHDVEQHQQVITRTETASAAEDPVRILFLAANPKDTSPLRLGEEVRTIAERLREADYRDRLQLEQDWAVRVGDLSLEPNVLRKSQYQVFVQFPLLVQTLFLPCQIFV